MRLDITCIVLLAPRPLLFSCKCTCRGSSKLSQIGVYSMRSGMTASKPNYSYSICYCASYRPHKVHLKSEVYSTCIVIIRCGMCSLPSGTHDIDWRVLNSDCNAHNKCPILCMLKEKCLHSC